METEWILKVVIVGLIHWVLAGLVLQDLARRHRVAGGRKAPWALAVLFITGFGSLAYLAFHPQMLTQENAEESFVMRKRILIIDDDTLLTHTIGMCLKQRGHDITVASSGIEAVKQLFKEQPDLLVADIGLPDCDGWFLAGLIKKLGWSDRVPVIMMSVLDPDREKISETKPYAYIQKPFDMGHLIQTVEKSLGEVANLKPCSSP